MHARPIGKATTIPLFPSCFVIAGLLLSGHTAATVGGQGTNPDAVRADSLHIAFEWATLCLDPPLAHLTVRPGTQVQSAKITDLSPLAASLVYRPTGAASI